MKVLNIIIILLMVVYSSKGQTPNESRQEYVISKDLNVYSQPSFDSPIEYSLKFNKEIEVLGMYNADWKLVRVHFISGRTNKLVVITGYSPSKSLNPRAPNLELPNFNDPNYGTPDYDWSRRKQKK